MLLKILRNFNVLMCSKKFITWLVKPRVYKETFPYIVLVKQIIAVLLKQTKQKINKLIIDLPRNSVVRMSKQLVK